MTRTRRLLAAATLLLSINLTSHAAFAGETKGTLTHPKETVALKFAYLIKGPDTFDAKKTIRRLILSGMDLGAKIQACDTLNCIDSSMTQGMIADLDAGPRINYWMAISGGKVQYSGTAELSVLKTSTDQPKELAGKLTIDDSAMGGPKVDVTFDAPLVKEFAKAR